MHRPSTTEESHQIEALTQAVDELRRRVALLEQWSAALPRGAQASQPIAPAALPATELPEISPGMLAAAGRVLLGIAGAYLLRAITETGLIPQLAGTTLGLLYAVGWLVYSIRIPAGRRLTVSMHAITAACIVPPLLWEATVRFHSVPVSVSAALLALFTILGQAFAWRRDHSALAAITAIAGAATAMALIIATLDPVPFAFALAAVALVVEFGAWRDRALSWRWLLALPCDFAAALLLYLVTRQQGLPEGRRLFPSWPRAPCCWRSLQSMS